MGEKIEVSLPIDEKNKVDFDGLCGLIGRLRARDGLDVSDLRGDIVQLQNLLAELEALVDYSNSKAAKPSCDQKRESPIIFERNCEVLLKQLKDLEERWRDYLGGENWPDQEYFNMDGFYPYYTHQKTKILFVGREACYMAGKNYIEEVYNALVNDDFNGWTVNQYPFHRRQFYIAYGILKALAECPQWKDLPWASDMAAGTGEGKEKRVFAVENGISWAFMNLSKISNQTGDYRTDSARYLPFVTDEGNRKFIREEIQILAPDVIIGANVYELVDILGYAAKGEEDEPCCYYYPPVKEKGLPPFLNCYHFAAIKSDKRCFYDPVMRVVEKHIRDRDLGWIDQLRVEK